MTMMSSRYADALATIRPPGCGCHPDLLRVANYGVMSGRSPEDIHEDIREAIPQGARKVLDREIESAVKKAMADHGKGGGYVHRKVDPIVKDGKAARERIIKQAVICDEYEIFESSPVRLHDDPEKDASLFLDVLFWPGELIFTGERYDRGVIGRTIRPVSKLCERYAQGEKPAPFLIVNPLDGQQTPTRGGDGTTMRGDGNVAVFRFCMAEFDSISITDQLRFWSAAKLPIVALVHSGGKSIHAWIDVQRLAVVETLEQWKQHIKNHLYEGLLVPMGVDAACSNPARLARMPGHFRTEKNAFQRILWLSPEGRTIT